MELSEKARRNKRKYNHQYTKEHYKRVPLDMSPGQYDTTKAAADSVGESVNGFIRKSVSERIERLNTDSDSLLNHKDDSNI